MVLRTVDPVEGWGQKSDQRGTEQLNAGSSFMMLVLKKGDEARTVAGK